MSRLGRFALLNTAGNAFVPLSGAVTAPLLASSLGVVGRGEVAAATSPVLLALTVAGLGLPEAATYFVSKRRHSKKTLLNLWVGIMAGAAIGLASIWLFREVLAGGNPALAETILLCSLALPLCLACGLLRGIAAGRELWLMVNLERFLTALLRLLAILGLLGLDSFNVLTASLAIVLSQALGGLVYVGLAFSRQRRRLLPEESAGFGEIYRFAGGAWFGSLAGVLLLRFDQLLMVPLSDSYQLGMYAVAVNIAELMLIGSNAIRDVMFSAESAEPKAERLIIASKIAFYGTLIISCTSFVLCLLFLPSLFGAEFSPATLFFGIMAIGFTLGAPGSIAGAGLASRGLPHLRSISLTIAAITNVVLVLFLVPSLGALGAAVATAISAAMGGVINQGIYSKRFGMSVAAPFALRVSDVAAMKSYIRKKDKLGERQHA